MRCSVPTGKEIHRDQKTGTERRYTSPSRRGISSSPSHPPRIPRNSAAGDWRWRPRALRDKPHQHTPPCTSGNQTTNPHEYTSSSWRPRNFRRYGREGAGRRGGGYIKCIKYGSDSPRPLLRRWIVGVVLVYLEHNVRGYSNNRNSGLSLPGGGGVSRNHPLIDVMTGSSLP